VIQDRGSRSRSTKHKDWSFAPAGIIGPLPGSRIARDWLHDH
jgi:hypothetical protein